MNKIFLKNLKIASSKIMELRDCHEDFFANISFNINVKGKEHGSISSKIPGGNITKAFIMDLRPFLLQKEYLYIPSLCNDIEKNVKDIDLLYTTRDFRKTWNKFYNGNNIGGVYTKINGKKITVEDKIKLWLNGKFMHPTDKKKKTHEKLKEITDTPFGIVDYVSFIDVLQRLAQLIIWFNENIIIKILEKNESKQTTK